MVNRAELQAKIKEKVLLKGLSGTGKTYCAVKVAEYVASKGKNVVYIDPEWGAERELELLSDEVLGNITLKVTPDWTTFKFEVMKNDACFLKVVDGLAEAQVLAKFFLQERYERLGHYTIADKEIRIEDKESFVLPWAAYSKVYDALREMVHVLVKHPYHILCTMPPLKETDSQKVLEEDINRKFDTVIELGREEVVSSIPGISSSGSIGYVAYLKKHRGKALTGTALLADHVEQLKGLFGRRFGDEV